MPLDTRSIAVTTAVISFFGFGFIGWLCHLSVSTCCKRALLGALVAYLATCLAVKAINGIITSAMIINYINRHKEETGDSRD